MGARMHSCEQRRRGRTAATRVRKMGATTHCWPTADRAPSSNALETDDMIDHQDQAAAENGVCPLWEPAR